VHEMWIILIRLLNIEPIMRMCRAYNKP